MLKLTTALNQKLIEAYYNWNADNNMFRFNCVIDVGYLAEPLRKILMRHKMFEPSSGTIILNLSTSACINIDFTGPEYYSEIGFQGMPCHLHIPWHAFLGVNVQISESATVFAPFPNVDRLLFDAENPSYVHPFRDIANGKPGTVEIDLNDIVSWLETKGHVGVEPASALATINALIQNDDKLFSEFVSYASELKNTRHIATEEAKEDFIVEQPESFVSSTEETNVAAKLEEVVKPLLDFGPLPGVNLNKAPSRYKGPPKLTVIKGGKT